MIRITGNPTASGARSRARTGTRLPSRDFKSPVSTFSPSGRACHHPGVLAIAGILRRPHVRAVYRFDFNRMNNQTAKVKPIRYPRSLSVAAGFNFDNCAQCAGAELVTTASWLAFLRPQSASDRIMDAITRSWSGCGNEALLLFSFAVGGARTRCQSTVERGQRVVPALLGPSLEGGRLCSSDAVAATAAQFLGRVRLSRDEDN